MNGYSDRLSELKARLQAATSEPWACEPSADYTEVYGLLIGDGAVSFDNVRTADIDLISTAPKDLRWAIEEIDHLRRYLDVLGEFAFAADRLRWALENPKPGRVERCRRSFEKAQRELLATPTWRPGECRGGCRRNATHEFVFEENGRTKREAACAECGRVWLAARQRAIDLGWQPDGVLRLEPIALSNVEAREVVQ